MQVCRIGCDDLFGGLFWMMNRKCPALIGRPLDGRYGAWVVVRSTKLRPPFGLEPFVPSFGVGRANDETGDSLIIFNNERQAWFKRGVWCRVNVTDQLAILIEVRGIATVVAGSKRDRVDSFKID